jgi:hypothetical protein
MSAVVAVESTGIDCQDGGAQNENPQLEVSSSSKEIDSEYVVYLTLGDGDFTYSLDLARYFKLSLASISTKQKATKLILTGVDTLETLTSKYKDSKSILQEIRNQQDETASMSLKIRHGVNAIVHPNEKDDEQVHETAADHVLFHHPHLGTENCSLHKRFLAHLFHSAKNHWMKRKGGIFHLTLVEGQYERWKCQEQAERHGLELLGSQKFAPPPVVKTDGTNNSLSKNGIHKSNRYHYRRHQTGKSFASRRPNSKSITYTFGRTIDKGMYITTTLPWQTPGSSSFDITTKQIAEVKPISVTTVKLPMLSCPFCDKEFLEKRSLKCHLRDKHQGATATKEQEVNDGQEQPRKKKKLEMGDTSTTIKASEILSFSCLHCEPHRVFQSEKALQSHNRAKHSGICTYIAPDWSLAKLKESRNIVTTRLPDGEPSIETDANKLKECYICGFKLIGRNLSHHFADFLPVDGLQTFSCDFCSKLFREERAKLQHMNFCTKRSI